MSIKARDWAAHYAPMPLTDNGKPDITARAILVELAEHANDQGTSCFPGPAHIEWATGASQITIDKALRRLERQGLIAKDGTRYGVQGYKLAMEKQRPSSDLQFIEARISESRRRESNKRSGRRRASTAKVSGPLRSGHAMPEDVETIIDEMADHAGVEITREHAQRIFRKVVTGAAEPPEHPLSFVLAAIRERPDRYVRDRP